MKLGFKLDNGKGFKIDFTALSYNDNQTIKPQIVAVTHGAFAEDKGIAVKDSRSGLERSTCAKNKTEKRGKTPPRNSTAAWISLIGIANAYSPTVF